MICSYRGVEIIPKELVHLALDDTREVRSSHDCRRTYASLEYLNGTDIYTLRNQLGQLGHSTISQTEEYIIDVIEASERKSRLKGGGLLIEETPFKVLDANRRILAKEKEA